MSLVYWRFSCIVLAGSLLVLLEFFVVRSLNKGDTITGNTSTNFTQAVKYMRPKSRQIVHELQSELFQLQNRITQGLLANDSLKQAILLKLSYISSTAYQLSQIHPNLERLHEHRLAEAIQRRLHRLQNPHDCASTRLLVCVINNWVGFGGMCHHLALCYHLALAMRRTLVVQYVKGNLYSKVIEPSSPCQLESYNLSTLDTWNGKTDTMHCGPQVIGYFLKHTERGKFPFPLDSLPQDIALQIQAFHGLPVAWWQGQILKYILRPVGDFEKLLHETETRIIFKSPVAGIHVRRTDKPQKYKHHLDEYMIPVSYWFQSYEQRQVLQGKHISNKTRRIFVATEDPTVVANLRTRYPSYVFINNFEASILSMKKSGRSKTNSLKGLLQDVFMLSKCDHLVCDANSNICRMAYELMQTRHTDASNRFTPVGMVYHNFPTLNRFRRVIDYVQTAERSKLHKVFTVAPTSSNLPRNIFWRRVIPIAPVNIFA